MIIRAVDLNAVITNEVVNKVPYYQVWAIEYPATEFLIHDIRTENVVTNIKQSARPNKIETLNFTIDPTQTYYENLNKLKTIIRLYEVDSNAETNQIYEGRILTDDTDFNNIKNIICEGELAFLRDGIQRPAKYENQTIEQWMTAVLDIYNQAVTADKRFHMGIVTVLDTKDDILRENDYINTFDLLQKQLVDSLGGYLVIEHIGSLRFLNYLENYGVANTQPVEFGTNLLDFKKTNNAADIITAVIPWVKPTTTDGTILNISSVNTGCDYIYNDVAVNEYGWIFGAKEFKDIDDPFDLMANGYEYLETLTRMGITLELTALDLALINIDIQRFNIGDSVRCVSNPHNIDMFLMVTKYDRDRSDPSKDRIILGDDVKNMTDLQLSEDAATAVELT